MQEIVLSAENLGKSYWLYSSNFQRIIGSIISPYATGATPLNVLSGLTFDLHRGEAIALIGKNGAGKSTALQILAGIIQPTEGSFSVNGRVCALLELGSGFNPEFTGRENIAIAGAIAGLTKQEVENSEEEIIRFADIGEYIDQPVKFYSSGMFVRLAFAVVIASKPDLLIVDEALAVGDIFFRQKCYSKLYEMRTQGMAVLLVTHNMADVTEFCSKAIFLHNGKPAYIGDSKAAMTQYYAIENANTISETPALTNDIKKPFSVTDKNSLWIYRNDTDIVDANIQVISLPGSHIRRMLVTDLNGIKTNVFKQGDTMLFHVEYYIGSDIATPVPGYVIWNSRNIPVSGKNVLHANIALPDFVHANSSLLIETEIVLDIELGEYTINLGLSHIPSAFNDAKITINSIDDIGQRIVHAQGCAIFMVVSDLTKSRLPSTHHGIASLPGKQSLRIFNENFL